jgi:hypothetical protein
LERLSRSYLVPTGEGDRLVDVVWAGRTVAMFAYDVSVRGTEITGKAAKA